MDVALCDIALQEEAALYRWLAFRLPRPAQWVVTNLARTRATAAAIFAAGYPDQEIGGRARPGRAASRRMAGHPA